MDNETKAGPAADTAKPAETAPVAAPEAPVKLSRADFEDAVASRQAAKERARKAEAERDTIAAQLKELQTRSETAVAAAVAKTEHRHRIQTALAGLGAVDPADVLALCPDVANLAVDADQATIDAALAKARDAKPYLFRAAEPPHNGAPPRAPQPRPAGGPAPTHSKPGQTAVQLFQTGINPFRH